MEKFSQILQNRHKENVFFLIFYFKLSILSNAVCIYNKKKKKIKSNQMTITQIRFVVT